MNKPLVSVVMPVYNAGAYVKEAIQSILDQTFTNFSFIILNDGSTDDSDSIIRTFGDERIRYIKHESNIGLISILNEGLNLAESKYIIRMDADDISLPERFAEQVSFMEANPEIDISGTWFTVMDTGRLVQHDLKNEECKVKLLQNTVLGHPTAILRRESIIKNNLQFDHKALYAEDYKFWAEASIKGLKLANIPKFLLLYRIHSEQISTLKSEHQLKGVEDIKLWYTQHFFGDLLKDKLNLYASFLNCSIDSFDSFTEIRILLLEIKASNRLNKYFDAKIFEEFLDNLLKINSFRIYVTCVDCNIAVLWRSIFDRYFYANTTSYQKATFFFKSIQKSLL